jgi:hypothetical protein
MVITKKSDYTLVYMGATLFLKATDLRDAVSQAINCPIAEKFHHIVVGGDGERIEICDKNDNVLDIAFWKA